MKFASKKQQERYEKGLCINCEDIREGKRNCHKCKEKYNISRRSYRSKLIKHGLCIDCHESSTGSQRCSQCLEKIKKYERNLTLTRRKNKQCIRCGQNNIANQNCEKCLVKIKARYSNRQQHLEVGLCSICSLPLVSSRYCCEHQRRQNKYNHKYYKSENGKKIARNAHLKRTFSREHNVVTKNRRVCPFKLTV